MADLRLDEIEGRTSGTVTPVGDLKYQLATAWVNFDGTGTLAIRDSYNVSSVTDIGTGAYEVNFESAMDNANYSRIISAGTSTSSDFRGIALDGGTITEVPFFVRSTANAAIDANIICVSVFGGKI